MENGPDVYYDAVDSGESRTQATWESSDLDSVGKAQSESGINTAAERTQRKSSPR